MISLAQLRLATKVRGTSQDPYLKGLELAAVDFLNAKSDRYYGPVEAGFREYLIGHGTTVLILEELPGGTLTVTEHVLAGDTGTVIVAGDDDGYLVRDRQLVRRGGHRWVPGYEYEAQYDRGYESGKEPARARQFVTGCVVHWNERRVPLPKVGETLTFDVPFHLREILGTLSRLRV